MLFIIGKLGGGGRQEGTTPSPFPPTSFSVQRPICRIHHQGLFEVEEISRAVRDNLSKYRLMLTWVLKRAEKSPQVRTQKDFPTGLQASHPLASSIANSDLQKSFGVL